jgi:hypothetical protein
MGLFSFRVLQTEQRNCTHVEEQSRKLGQEEAEKSISRRCGGLGSTNGIRERDSNPRYRSETCKVRRLRKLRGINQFRDFRETACSPLDTLNSAVSRSLQRRNAGDCVAESGRYEASHAAKLVRTCLPAAQSKSETSLRRRAQKKVNKWTFPEIPAHALRHDFRFLVMRWERSVGQILVSSRSASIDVELDFGRGVSGAVETEILHALAQDSREARITTSTKTDSLKRGKCSVTVPRATGMRLTLT